MYSFNIGGADPSVHLHRDKEGDEAFLTDTRNVLSCEGEPHSTPPPSDATPAHLLN